MWLSTSNPLPRPRPREWMQDDHLAAGRFNNSLCLKAEVVEGFLQFAQGIAERVRPVKNTGGVDD